MNAMNCSCKEGCKCMKRRMQEGQKERMSLQLAPACLNGSSLLSPTGTVDRPIRQDSWHKKEKRIKSCHAHRHKHRHAEERREDRHSPSIYPIPPPSPSNGFSPVGFLIFCSLVFALLF
mmetsp:Transcript_16065/g.32555  ORF Transcript_16065/g.32555 Transcript_16065/m.32555 type:complete len:119 (-) Transcript_16065:1345-1701(-)